MGLRLPIGRDIRRVLIGDRLGVGHERHQLHVADHEARVAGEALLALAADLLQVLLGLRDVILALLPGLLVDNVMRVLVHGRRRGSVRLVATRVPWRAVGGGGRRILHTAIEICHACSGQDGNGEKRSHVVMKGDDLLGFALLRRIKSIIETNFDVATKFLI